MAIDRQETLHVSSLARLEISSEEAEQYSHQLSHVLDYFELLDRVDTDGIEPLYHPLGITNVFAADVPRKSFPREEMLRNAPKQDGQFYRVPAVIALPSE